MSEWISVKDRLPPIGEYILVFDGETVYEACVRTEDLMESNRHGFEDIISKEWPINHWMPLPEPPMEAFER